MKRNDLPRSALEQAALVRARKISSVELVRHYLQRIEQKNPELWAFVTLFGDRALADARRADQRLGERGDRPLPMFLGLPTGIKDHDHVRFAFTRGGSHAYRFVMSPVDGPVAKACRAGGFALCGKLSTSELALLPVVEPATHPPTRNPIDPDHTAGGSSGGTAAAIASGMLPIAPGADGAGSIRIPASFCGLVGIKPSRGALPHPYGMFDRVKLSTTGPLAHDVRDAAALYDVMAGFALFGERPRSGSFLAAAMRAPRPMRIRLLLRTNLTDVDPEIEAAVRRAAHLLEEAGHSIDEGEPIEGSIDEFLPIWERLAANPPVLFERTLQASTRWLRERGRRHRQDVIIEQKRGLEARVVASLGADVDAWLTPTVAKPPPRVGAWRGLDGEATFRAAAPLGAFTAPFNLTGQPAISVPAGRGSTGLPIGVQLVGRFGADAELVSLAAQLEARLGAAQDA